MIDILVTGGSRKYLFQRTREQEIIQNVNNAVERYKGNVVLARHKGISDVVDKPSIIARTQIAGEIIEEIEREEPRFEVTDVIPSEKYIETGELEVTIRGVIKDE